MRSGSVSRVESATRHFLARQPQARRAAIKTWARSKLDQPATAQRSEFGRFANANIRTAPGTDHLLREKVLTVLNELPIARLSPSTMTSSAAALPDSKTKAIILLSKNLYAVASHLTINRPQTVTIRWSTEESEATGARWSIQGSVGAPPPRITGGYAGSGTAGEFNLNLADVLPEEPLEDPVGYFITVRAIASHGRRATEDLGRASKPVTITYERSAYVQPPIEVTENLGHYQRIEFYVDRVKCVDKTNEAATTDHILIDGFYTLADGTVDRMGLWTVGSDFTANKVEPDEDERPVRSGSFKLFPYDYSGGNLLNVEPTDNPNIPWPRTYTFNLFMAERDAGGGFGEFMEAIIGELMDQLEPIIKEHLGGLVGAAVGAAVGSAIPGLGTLIGAAIGAVLGEVIGKIFDWLREAFTDSDNPLADRRFELNLSSSSVATIHNLPGTVNDLPDGKTEFASPIQTINFKGLGGEYEVDVFWKATRRVMDF